MAVIRWRPTGFTPARDLVRMQEEMERLFDGFLGNGAQRGDLEPLFSPPVDIRETPEEYVIRADLPGLSQKDVKVNLMGETLTIRGERKQEHGEHDGNYHRIERVYGAFERSFNLGAPLRADQVKATYKDGVLEIRVPKAEEARLKEIEVKDAP